MSYPQPRSAVTSTPLVHHGAIAPSEIRRLGLDPKAIADFSVNVNPYGPAPTVRAALAQVPLDRYPDPEAAMLREALARHLQRSPDQILVGNGSAELLWLIAIAFLDHGDSVLVLEPTFGEYARVSRLMGAEVLRWRADSREQFAIQTEAIDRLLRRARPRIVFLCHPNNPTGLSFPLEALTAWSATHPATLFVVDEAYLPFIEGGVSALTLRAPNILALHSMTKAHALAGLRLGYAVGHKEVIDALRRVQPPWSVNALAQAAGLAALQAQTYLKATLALLREQRRMLRRALRDVGWQPLPSDTHYFLVPVDHAAQTRSALLARGLVVRDCSSFGLPQHIRIATRTPEENARLVRAMAELVLPSDFSHHPKT